MNTCQVDGLDVQLTQTTPSTPGQSGHRTWQCVISSCGVSSRTMFTSHHFQRHYQNCDSASTPQSGTSHKTWLRGFGGNGSIAWTSAVSHVGRTSDAFKITMKLQTFLFQMVVTSCISVQYLWKYGFAKSSDNLCAPCTDSGRLCVRQELKCTNEDSLFLRSWLKSSYVPHWIPRSRLYKCIFDC